MRVFIASKDQAHRRRIKLREAQSESWVNHIVPVLGTQTAGLLPNEKGAHLGTATDSTELAGS